MAKEELGIVGGFTIGDIGASDLVRAAHLPVVNVPSSDNGGGVPSIEVGCVKDFPGAWAEYRVYDGGLLQIVHRISSSEALAWSEACRDLYSDFGLDYTEYALGRLDHRCFAIPLRS